MANILEEKLREAACVGDTEAVLNILSQNIDINSQNSVNGWYIISSLFIVLNSLIHPFSRTALHWACKRGHDDIEKILLDNGADKSKKNYKGETPYDLSSHLNLNSQEQVSIHQSEELPNIYLPNYLKNPQFGTQLDISNIKRGKHTDFSTMPTTALPSSPNDGESTKKYIELSRYKKLF